MSSKYWLIGVIGAAVIGILIAFLAVFPRAQVPVVEGTAPSVVTRSTGEEAEPLREPGTAPPAREAESSSVGGRGARGSGIEGVTSGGTTHSPPDGR